MNDKQTQTENISEAEPLPGEQATPEAADKHEDALETIKELKAESQLPKKRNWFLFVLSIIFFPITGIVLLFKWASRKIKLSITIKTTIIFAFLFGVLMSAYVIFIISSIESRLTLVGTEARGDILRDLK